MRRSRSTPSTGGRELCSSPSRSTSAGRAACRDGDEAAELGQAPPQDPYFAERSFMGPADVTQFQACDARAVNSRRSPMAVDLLQETLAASSAPAVEPIVEARSLHKTYATGKVEVHALRGVDLAIEPGEMVAIMGPSGCGKTTLLNCLSGLDAIDAGEIWFEGTDLGKLSDRQRTDYRARRMGFVF